MHAHLCVHVHVHAHTDTPSKSIFEQGKKPLDFKNSNFLLSVS